MVIAASGTACDLMGVVGSGDVISESREVSGFTQIVLRGRGRVSLEVTGEESLTIEADANLMPLLTTQVEDGVLELGATEAISPSSDIVYTITVSSLEGVSVQGSGELNAPDVEAPTFEATVSGSGRLFLPELSADELVVRISGSGDAELSGSTEHLELDVSGSGSYLGEGLVSTTAEVGVSGAGEAVVNVSEELEASASGSGSIVYLGDPESVESSVSDSGEIEDG